MINIILGVAIFSYAIWTIMKFIKRSSKGKCAACDLRDACEKCQSEASVRD
ncbi:FeoB-associated Cys-rich membrane protein [Bacillus andreraoultii]|uniref:FeoB-associated Cys-rich membrane protein n=1 Tax=Bacillus andreraoultii TaxID=1499685 RepID=UPI00053B9E9D|nr:FeoB-associated Cys-rich membrane protein [Bacillus andreraoultii]